MSTDSLLLTLLEKDIECNRKTADDYFSEAKAFWDGNGVDQNYYVAWGKLDEAFNNGFGADKRIAGLMAQCYRLGLGQDANEYMAEMWQAVLDEDIGRIINHVTRAFQERKWFELVGWASIGSELGHLGAVDLALFGHIVFAESWLKEGLYEGVLYHSAAIIRWLLKKGALLIQTPLRSADELKKMKVDSIRRIGKVYYEMYFDEEEEKPDDCLERALDYFSIAREYRDVCSSAYIVSIQYENLQVNFGEMLPKEVREAQNKRKECYTLAQNLLAGNVESILDNLDCDSGSKFLGNQILYIAAYGYLGHGNMPVNINVAHDYIELCDKRGSAGAPELLKRFNEKLFGGWSYRKPS